MTIEEIYELPVDSLGWRRLPTGNYVTLGNGVKLGNYVTLGDGVTLGDDVKLGDDATDFKCSPLQIQGSRDLLYVAGPKIIGVGCERHDAEWWNKHYKSVGRREKYAPKQIAEYRNWLDVAMAWQKTLAKAAA